MGPLPVNYKTGCLLQAPWMVHLVRDFVGWDDNVGLDFCNIPPIDEHWAVVAGYL